MLAPAQTTPTPRRAPSAPIVRTKDIDYMLAPHTYESAKNGRPYRESRLLPRKTIEQN